MKIKFINELQDREQISDVFLVKLINMQVGKNGKAYLNLILCDKTGEIETRMWDKVEPVFQTIRKNSFVKVEGKINPFQGRKQFVITSCNAVDEKSLDLSDFIAISKFDLDKMMEEVLSLINSLKDEELKNLGLQILSNEEVKDGFKNAPAAKGVHHAYAGGLMELVLSVAKLADMMASHYKGVNRDLAVFSALFHDIGKIHEFEFGKATDYSDEGKLVGHIVIGCEILDRFVKEIPNFNLEKSWQIKHIMLSHHGELEFGSPKRPKTLEALIVSKADDLDSKMNAIQTFIMKDETPGNFTQFNKMYERLFYKGNGIEGYSPKIINDEAKAVEDPLAKLKKHFGNIGK